MVTTYSPRAEWRPAGRRNDWHDGQLIDGDLFRAPLPEPPPPGLVLARNSDTQGKRNGWKGITPGARRSVHRSCAALEDQRRRVAFWTITLSPEQLDWIERYDRWPDFQQAIRHRLVRALRARGLRPLVVGVVEIHPERSMREGRICPHIHVAFVGRQHGWGRWALSTADLDLIICKALMAAQCFDLEVRACGNVQPVRRSVGSYLGSYMKKGSGPVPVCLENFELCPRQWFFRSRELLRLVRMMTVPLPIPFVTWVHDRRDWLAAQGLLECGRIPIAEPRAPAVFGILWGSVANVAAVLAQWHEDIWEAEWEANLDL
jgi:hypothetical protein